MKLAHRYRTALITGASRGLGRALALRLAEAGVSLALVARGEEELAETAREIRRRHGQNIPLVTIVEDIGDKEAIYRIAARAVQAIGAIELLINNASQLGPVPLRLLMDTDCEDFETVLQSNLLGPFRLSKAFAGPMLLADRGLILNISSDAAVEAYPAWGAYGVSKAALDHLTRIFAVELAGTGVALHSVDPGEMDTRMHAQAVPGADPKSLADPSAVAAQIVKLIYSANRIPSGERLVASKWEEQL